MTAGQPFLEELRDFLAFLRSLWGLLAGISVLFPLSNVLFSVIPLEGGGNPFQNLSPGIVTALTMLTCIFLTFATFGQRKRFAIPARRLRYARVARFSFAGALVALALYLLASDPLYRELITESSDPDTGAALYDGLFAALY
ncbi:MAG: hypothetical protein H0V20_08205, partial [Actinobacteria bacterium]|nr:hypothetical protein [Actinomycetota bacterium]